MHTGRVHPDEERLAVLLGLVDELQRVVEDVLVDLTNPLIFAGLEKA